MIQIIWRAWGFIIRRIIALILDLVFIFYETKKIMELSENERLMLVQKKEEIGKLTREILDIYQDPKERIELTKKMYKILELLSIISSYSKSNYNLGSFREAVIFITGSYGELLDPSLLRVQIEIFCAAANSVEFKFTKSGLKLNIPKIDISIFRT